MRTLSQLAWHHLGILFVIGRRRIVLFVSGRFRLLMDFLAILFVVVATYTCVYNTIPPLPSFFGWGQSPRMWR